MKLETSPRDGKDSENANSGFFRISGNCTEISAVFAIKFLKTEVLAKPAFARTSINYSFESNSAAASRLAQNSSGVIRGFCVQS